MGETNERTARDHGRITVIGAWCLVALWAAVIFFMSAHTGSDLSTGQGITALVKRWLSTLAASVVGPDVDVVSPLAHFCEYTVFGALLFLALHLTRARSAHNATSGGAKRLLPVMLLAIGIASLYGITDEIHQYFVPGRACDPVDWLVDTAGATLGAAISLLIARNG